MANYIMDLRRLVGQRTLMMMGASVIVEDGDGRVLLQRRSDNGLRGYHGGAVEIDERVEDAARRELFEETGLTAGTMALFGVFSGPEMHYTYPNGDDVSIVDALFLCRDWSGTPRAQESEVAELRFFARDALPPDDEISPPNRPGLRRWKERTW